MSDENCIAVTWGECKKDRLVKRSWSISTIIFRLNKDRLIKFSRCI